MATEQLWRDIQRTFIESHANGHPFSYDALAAMFGVGVSALKQHAMLEGWMDQARAAALISGHSAGSVGLVVSDIVRREVVQHFGDGTTGEAVEEMVDAAVQRSVGELLAVHASCLDGLRGLSEQLRDVVLMGLPQTYAQAKADGWTPKDYLNAVKAALQLAQMVIPQERLMHELPTQYTATRLDANVTQLNERRVQKYLGQTAGALAQDLSSLPAIEAEFEGDR